MKKRITLLYILLLFSSLISFADLTIQHCIEKSQENYPLIKKYSLLTSLKDIELSDINKSWLPRIDVYGQLTGQNVVPSYPEALSDVLKQMGQNVEGLGKVQYKIGIDVVQNIWDGGQSKVRREVSESREKVMKASLDVEMYAVRERVENLFFAILLLEEQIAQNKITYGLLTANLEKLRSMLRNGVAMQSDVDMVEAQILVINQNINQAEYNAQGYRRVLEIFMGESISGEKLIIPDAVLPVNNENCRPELHLFDTKIYDNSLSDKLTKTALMPKVGFFAQAYYGYPGFDYFKSMMSRNLSFNILAGVKISWNIDAFYTKKNLYRKTVLNSENLLAEKELFLFNSSIMQTSQMESIEGMRKVMADDAKIIALRSNVRKAAESQLQNGVIDATALLTKISDENVAMLTSKLHEMEYLKEIYKLKYILNK